MMKDSKSTDNFKMATIPEQTTTAEVVPEKQSCFGKAKSMYKSMKGPTRAERREMMKDGKNKKTICEQCCNICGLCGENNADVVCACVLCICCGGKEGKNCCRHLVNPCTETGCCKCCNSICNCSTVTCCSA